MKINKIGFFFINVDNLSSILLRSPSTLENGSPSTLENGKSVNASLNIKNPITSTYIQ